MDIALHCDLLNKQITFHCEYSVNFSRQNASLGAMASLQISHYHVRFRGLCIGMSLLSR